MGMYPEVFGTSRKALVSLFLALCFMICGILVYVSDVLDMMDLYNFVNNWNTQLVGAVYTYAIRNNSNSHNIRTVSNNHIKSCPMLECNKTKGIPVPVILHPLSWDQLEAKYRLNSSTQSVSWTPSNCTPPWTIAIIVPYRNRDTHLRIFLNNMIPFLQKQKVAFTVFIIDQEGKELFNRAALMNIGYIEASKIHKFDCYVFHDVDLIPENACNLYACNPVPRHLTVAVDKFNYRLPYSTIFGGATILNATHMSAINGFSNYFFGWGGEDDNIYQRVVQSGYHIVRYPPNIARYRTIKHSRDNSNPSSGRSFKEVVDLAQYKKYDGLNNMDYTVTNITQYPLYTQIKVHLPGPDGNSVNARDYLHRKIAELKKKMKQNSKGP